MYFAAFIVDQDFGSYQTAITFVAFAVLDLDTTAVHAGLRIPRLDQDVVDDLGIVCRLG